jgi:hypothetical protein
MKKGMKRPLLALQMTVELPLKAGGTFNWKVLDLAALVQYYATNSELYRTFLRHAVTNYTLPFKAMIHEDEVTPGNLVMMRKKVHGWYFSLEEFGLYIRSESAYILFASLQSDFVSKVDGGFSCVVAALYRALVFRTQLFTAGIAVNIGAEHRLL